MKILICGDRNWTSEISIRKKIEEYNPSLIIHGCARGADRISGKIGKEMGIEVLEFPADWEKYGKAAGPLRNEKMLKEGNPDMVIAFHKNISLSKGTKDMVRRAKQSGKKCEIISKED